MGERVDSNSACANHFERLPMKKKLNKKYAMFNRDENGIIIGFCNDSLCMTYRHNCVYVWDYPPNHYFKPQHGDFIICLSKKSDDVEVFPLIKKNHTFKGNYLFKQKKDGEWVTYKNAGPVVWNKEIEVS